MKSAAATVWNSMKDTFGIDAEPGVVVLGPPLRGFQSPLNFHFPGFRTARFTRDASPWADLAPPLRG